MKINEFWEKNHWDQNTREITKQKQINKKSRKNSYQTAT